MSQSFRTPAKVLRRLKRTPEVTGDIRSWPRFMVNYALGFVPNDPYRFRNGARLKIGRGVDHVPIIEIFLDRDYGPPPAAGVVLDIGANIGAFSVFAGFKQPDLKIYAYEPSPDFFALLQENVRLNGLEKQVKCFNAAVSDESSDRPMYVGGGLSFPTLVAPSTGLGAGAIGVPCTTLSEIIDGNGLQRVDLLKMDCEGAEYDVLYSTPPAYLRRISEIRMEYHQLPAKDWNARALAEFLEGNGYAITLAKANSPTHGNLWASRRA